MGVVVISCPVAPVPCAGVYPRAVPARRCTAFGSFVLPAILLLVMVTAVSGMSRRVRAAGLDAPVTASWSGIGLRDWAARASEATGLPVLVDSRLDPDTPIRLDCREEPWRDVISRGARAARVEVATLRSSVWIVPPGKAAAIIRAEKAREWRLATLPSPQRSVLGKTGRSHWNAGARPRDLVRELASEYGVGIEGVEGIPHDHLPALSLAELTVAERLDLLLVPFDLRIDWQEIANGASPVPRRPTGRIIALDADLPVEEGTSGRETIGKETPPVRKPARRPSREPPRRAAERHTFSLQVAAPLDELLATCATRLELRLNLDRESLARRGIAPGEIVRLTVKDASRDELLDAILGPLGLAWTIHDDTLRVFAR